MVTIHESIVYGALGEVLGHLHRVSEHFRNHQQQDTANLIARLCVNLVEAVEGGMGHILENQSIVGVGRPNGGEFIAAGSENPVSVGIQQQATMAVRGEVGMRESESRIRAVGKLPAPPGLTTANSENPISASNQQQATMAVRGEAGMGESETRICAMGRLPAPPGTTAAGFENSLPVGIQQQATMAVGGGVDIRENEIRSCAIGKLPAPPGATIQPGAGSWAQIANRPDTARPSQGAAQLMSPSASISGGQAVAAPPAALPEPVEEKAGVVRIYGSATKGEFRHITSRIHEGPLQEVRVESNNSVRVVFQHVSHALEFVKSDEEMQERLGQGRIGKGYTVEMADIINWNDDLRRMKQPVRERRRLSFARKGLLTGGLTAAKWKHEMLTIAGSGNVDFLWVFNSGNATAVFSSTIVARKVLDTVNRWKEHRREYSGVSVGYSSDTCEKELDLLRENNQPCYRKHAQPKRFMPPPRRPDYRQG